MKRGIKWPENRLFQKKTKNKRGFEDMEFPGVLKKENVEIPGVN